MTSRGDSETVRLRQNIEDQLKRLFTQLSDLEQMKEELDEDEYISTKQETIDQLQEFEKSLGKMTTGNMSLVDSVGSAQLAIQAAIRSTTSPDILNMFVKKENGALRSKLVGLESDRKLGRISADSYNTQSLDILRMLEKLGETLSVKELELLKKDSVAGGFVSASSVVNDSVLNTAAQEIGNTKGST